MKEYITIKNLKSVEKILQNITIKLSMNNVTGSINEK